MAASFSNGPGDLSHINRSPDRLRGDNSITRAVTKGDGENTGSSSSYLNRMCGELLSAILWNIRELALGRIFRKE